MARGILGGQTSRQTTAMGRSRFRPTPPSSRFEKRISTCSTDGANHAGVSSVCNHEYRSSNDAGSTVIIEENGPVKAVLKADGDLKDASGNVYMHFTVRMFFYKDKTAVKASTALRNADLGGSNTFASAFKGHQGWDARIGVNLSGATSWNVANETAAPTTGSFSSASDGVTTRSPAPQDVVQPPTRRTENARKSAGQ